MAVPGSGEIRLGALAFEKLENNYNDGLPGVIDTSYGPFSLRDITQGGDTYGGGETYDVTNIESPNFPDNVAGFGMGEFYSYDHDFQPIACSKAMDVVFLLDYTSSMINDMNTLKSNVASISSKVVERSGGDYRLAAVLIDQDSSPPSYWSNGTVVAQLNAANRYNSDTVYLAAMIPFASANKSDFDNKIGYLNQSTNSATSMELGWGVLAPEPNDIAIDRVLNNNLAGSFRAGVNRMIILITDNAPDGDGDDAFNGAEEYAKMGTLSNQAVANTTTISIIGNISNSTSSDGSTTRHDIYNGYANNTGGSTNFSGSPANVNTFIDNICNDIEQNFPSVTTNDPSNISSFGFRMNGNVTAQGGSVVSTRGFVKSLSSSNLIPGASGVTSHTSGSGTGTFFLDLTGQTDGTTFYYRAYAVNSTGSSFGEIKSVTTLLPVAFQISDQSHQYGLFQTGFAGLTDFSGGSSSSNPITAQTGSVSDQTKGVDYETQIAINGFVVNLSRSGTSNNEFKIYLNGSLIHTMSGTSQTYTRTNGVIAGSIITFTFTEDDGSTRSGSLSMYAT